MKILTAQQIRKMDQLTIQKEPIKSIDLMERAGKELARALTAQLKINNRSAVFFCGPGNNGGDGFVMARLLDRLNVNVEVVAIKTTSRSEDNQTNLNRLKNESPKVGLHTFTDFDFRHLSPDALCIDALLGTGINRPVTGDLAEIIGQINALPNQLISVDVPSGLQIDGASSGSIIQADEVLTLQTPKLSFLMSDTERHVPSFKVIDIGLHGPSLEAEHTDSFLLDRKMLRPMLRSRPNFSHKGNYGHALLVCGSYGKAGAAILAAKAAMRSGLALLTCHLPKSLVPLMQTAVPEAMVVADQNEKVLSHISDIAPYSTLGIGSGLGVQPESVSAMEDLLQLCNMPIVLDADALNILAKHPLLWTLVPANSILTPHPGEFKRLAGESSSSWEEWEKQKDLAEQHKVIVILKGAHTKIVTPDRITYINNTGNPGMATAGSGDVLTGIVTGLLGRGYAPEQAACLGVFLHGLSGDFAAQKVGQESLIASDLIVHLSEAMKSLDQNNHSPIFPHNAKPF